MHLRRTFYLYVCFFFYHLCETNLKKSWSLLNLIKNDPWLAPYKEAIEGRYQYVVNKEKNLTGNGRQTLSEMASGYLYFGLHKTKSGWVFREWAPNATAIYLIGTFNEWKKDDRYKLQRLGNGIWEIALAEGLLHHEDLFKLLVEWEGGSGERIPAWIRRVVQDENTKIFSSASMESGETLCVQA